MYVPNCGGAHIRPFAAFAPSTQTAAPVAHEMTPCLHGAPGFPAHDAPAVHATQLPAALHTRFVPQLVPGARFVMPSSHVGEAPEQLCKPVRHGVGLPVHAEPCVHMPQMPPLHVRPTPHIVPFVTFAVPSTQRTAPLLQSVTPCLQTLGLPLHAAPCVHAMHMPLELHTWFVPQLVPAVRFTIVSTQTCAPVAHDVTPCLHGVGFVVHDWFATHATHAPAALHTRSVPHDEPTAFGVPSTHAAPPVHVCVPFLQRSGFVLHAAPVLHATHPPIPLHTWFMPHAVPEG